MGILINYNMYSTNPQLLEWFPGPRIPFKHLRDARVQVVARGEVGLLPVATAIDKPPSEPSRDRLSPVGTFAGFKRLATYPSVAILAQAILQVVLSRSPHVDHDVQSASFSKDDTEVRDARAADATAAAVADLGSKQPSDGGDSTFSFR